MPIPNNAGPQCSAMRAGGTDELTGISCAKKPCAHFIVESPAGRSPRSTPRPRRGPRQRPSSALGSLLSVSAPGTLQAEDPLHRQYGQETIRFAKRTTCARCDTPGLLLAEDAIQGLRHRTAAIDQERRGILDNIQKRHFSGVSG